MAHLLLFDLPGGNDFTIIEDAVAAGHQVTLVTSEAAHYQGLAGSAASLSLLVDIIEVSPFTYAEVEEAVLERNRRLRFDAVLCLVDIRNVEASQIAARLGLPFLNTATARLTRDKVQVRERLKARGIRQPRFASASNISELRDAVAAVGFPCVVKPADGYGSQNVTIVRDADEFEILMATFKALVSQPADYGLGARSGGRFSVERYVVGDFIGSDVFSSGGRRLLLGINDKRMFAPPSFAIRGSCFPTDRYDRDAIEAYSFAILDAIDFDFGAAHIEMIVAADGLYLVEVNPRLVSAQIPHQMGYAFEQSVYLALVDLHLGRPLADFTSLRARHFSAIRWLSASQAGTLRSITLPDQPADSVCRVVLFKMAGDAVVPPRQNGDRLGYVIAVGDTQTEAEAAAEDYLAAVEVVIEPSPTPTHPPA